MAMGAADVVPGVSGGTIAFISGIYEELISTIHNLNFGFFKHWKKNGFKDAWKKYNLSFLISLLIGIAISILSLAKIISILLKNHPILVWSFFFGLVIASILFVGKQITSWKPLTWVILIIASILSYLITIAEPMGSPESTWFLFFAGFIAIIAMILPGISGAFILLLLGAYTSVIGILTQLNTGISKLDFTLIGQAILKLSVFALGAILGIKVFSKILTWLFTFHKNLILAALTGFMVGALNKIWPWKQIISYRVNSHGEQVPFLERSILPNQYAGEPLLFYAVLLAIMGFFTIFLLEKLATTKSS
jgi:putative membrane protein